MATFYFNGAADLAAGQFLDWQTLGNWWMDDTFSTQASSLPTSSDSVVMSATCDTNSGSAPTVVNLTMSGSYVYVGISLTVTGMATFNGQSYYNYGTLNGNCTFNGSSWNSGPAGTINGDAIFNDSSYNYQTVNGNATFSDNSYNLGTVNGNATFNGSAQMQSGTVTGNATFNGSSSMDEGSVEGNSTFNDTSLLDGNNYPSIYGTVVLNDYATANGSWNAGGGPTAFNDHANLSNQYVTTQFCEFNDHATCGGQGMRQGATFNDFSVCAATADYGWPIFTFNDSATGGVTMQGEIFPDVTYNDNSYGSGKAKSLTIEGAAAMQNAYLNGYNPVFDYSFTRPQYGINGSSILGIV